MTSKDISRRTALQLGALGMASATIGTLPFGISGARAQSPAKVSWMSWGGSKSIERIAAAISTQLPALGSQYSIEIRDGGPGDQDVAAVVRLALASGQNMPEIVMLNRTQVTEFAAAGELLPLDDIYSGIQDDMYAGAVSLAEVGGQLVGVPFGLNSKLFYYRSDLYEKAGVDPTAIGSVDDFINAGRSLQAKANTNIVNLGPQPVAYWPGELISAYPDSKFFADESGAFTIGSNPAFRDAFSFLKNIYDAGVTTKVDDWSSDWQPAIVDNKVASFLCSNWLKLFLPTFAPAQSGLWKVGLWPKLSPLADQRYGSEAGGSVFVVLRRSANAKAAAEYLRQVFLEKAGALVVYNSYGQTPLIKSAKDEFLALSANPQKPAEMSDDDFALRPGNYFGPQLALAELESYDYVKVLQYDPAASKGLDIMNQWLRKYMADSVDLDGALSSAQGDMESQIGNPYLM